MAEPACPFCVLREDLVFYEGDLVLALWDAFPASPGHALVVPRRHVASWWEASDAERVALIAALDTVRQAVIERYEPDGFNIGINIGAAAGQTIFHLHVHLIPRYTGDVPDPRGGVRYVIPASGNYMAPGHGPEAVDRA
jgi:ATP adenylyltransferase